MSGPAAQGPRLPDWQCPVCYFTGEHRKDCDLYGLFGEMAERVHLIFLQMENGEFVPQAAMDSVAAMGRELQEARRAAPPRDDELLQLAWQAFCNWASKGVDETPDMNALAQAVRDRGFPTDVRRGALGTDPR